MTRACPTRAPAKDPTSIPSPSIPVATVTTLSPQTEARLSAAFAKLLEFEVPHRGFEQDSKVLAVLCRCRPSAFRHGREASSRPWHVFFHGYLARSLQRQRFRLARSCEPKRLLISALKNQCFSRAKSGVQETHTHAIRPNSEKPGLQEGSASLETMKQCSPTQVMHSSPPPEPTMIQHGQGKLLMRCHESQLLLLVMKVQKIFAYDHGDMKE